MQQGSLLNCLWSTGQFQFKWLCLTYWGTWCSENGACLLGVGSRPEWGIWDDAQGQGKGSWLQGCALLCVVSPGDSVGLIQRTLITLEQRLLEGTEHKPFLSKCTILALILVSSTTLPPCGYSRAMHLANPNDSFESKSTLWLNQLPAEDTEPFRNPDRPQAVFQLVLPRGP